MLAQPLLTTRVSIERVTSNDESLYCSLFTDAQTMRFVGPVLSLAQARRTFQRWLQHSATESSPRILWKAVARADGRAIGICHLHIALDSKRAEAGLMIKPDCQLNGFGAEILSALLSAAFLTFSIGEIWVQYDARNTCAERLFMRLGLAPRSLEGADLDRAALRVRSAFRESWGYKLSAAVSGTIATQ